MKKILITSILFFGLAVSFAAPVANATTDAFREVKLTNPIGGSSASEDKKAGVTDINILVGRVIKTLLGLLGSVALVAFCYGGFQWLTSAGNDEKISSGLNSMLYAAIGIFVIFGSYAILSTVLGIAGQ